MKYYLIEISEGDSKIAGKAVYSFADRNEAVANFHSKLGSAMKSDLFTSEQVLVINDSNAIIMAEKYIKNIEPVVAEADAE